ncbi:Hypothetical protein NTJ_03073 [Nesidiocoris tenuis]|uniref:Uncharacterized protein n=1 Tax=Nesidiocoris tenuis TaxID=355587 RepID=A0ABN7ADB4_9HEMI|nr:Hypothetical protein NTJ_03073 [Nesidiocoris tenuis]
MRNEHWSAVPTQSSAPLIPSTTRLVIRLLDSYIKSCTVLHHREGVGIEGVTTNFDKPERGKVSNPLISPSLGGGALMRPATRFVPVPAITHSSDATSIEKGSVGCEQEYE